MKKYVFYFLFLFVGLFSSCDSNGMDDCVDGPKWDGNGQPVWLQQKLESIVYQEQGTSSYLLVMSAQLEKFKHNNEYYLSLKYTGYAGGNVKREHLFYTETGCIISGKDVQMSYNMTREIMWTTQVGGEEGYVPKVECAEEIAWLQKEVDRLCENRDDTDETIMCLRAESFDYSGNTYISLQNHILSSNDVVIYETTYYTKAGKVIEEENPVFAEVSQLKNHFNTKNIWLLHVDILRYVY